MKAPSLFYIVISAWALLRGDGMRTSNDEFEVLEEDGNASDSSAFLSDCCNELRHGCNVETRYIKGNGELPSGRADLVMAKVTEHRELCWSEDDCVVVRQGVGPLFPGPDNRGLVYLDFGDSLAKDLSEFDEVARQPIPYEWIAKVLKEDGSKCDPPPYSPQVNKSLQPYIDAVPDWFKTATSWLNVAIAATYKLGEERGVFERSNSSSAIANYVNRSSTALLEWYCDDTAFLKVLVKRLEATKDILENGFLQPVAPWPLCTSTDAAMVYPSGYWRDRSGSVPSTFVFLCDRFMSDHTLFAERIETLIREASHLLPLEVMTVDVCEDGNFSHSKLQRNEYFLAADRDGGCKKEAYNRKRAGLLAALERDDEHFARQQCIFSKNNADTFAFYVADVNNYKRSDDHMYKLYEDSLGTEAPLPNPCNMCDEDEGRVASMMKRDPDTGSDRRGVE